MSLNQPNRGSGRAMAVCIVVMLLGLVARAGEVPKTAETLIAEMGGAETPNARKPLIRAMAASHEQRRAPFRGGFFRAGV